MTPRYKTLAGFLCLTLLACGSGAPSEPVVPPSCPPSQGPGTVVGCGLAPRVALLGVDEQAFYTVDGSRTFFTVARQTGQPTKLYHSQLFNYYMGIGTSQLPTTSFQAGKIYLLDQRIADGKVSGGLMSLDVRTPGSPSLALRMDPINTVAFVLADGFVYFQDRQNLSGPIPPIVRASLVDGQSQVVYAGQGDPFAVHGGYLYFMDVYGGIRRVPVAGGADNLILAKLPPASERGSPAITYFDLGLDDNCLYVPTPSVSKGAPHTVQRYAVTGGDSGTTVASISSVGEVPLGPPTKLQVEGNYLYFMLVNGLARLQLGGDGRFETLGPATAPPVFDATSIYVTQQMGGDDSPLQGIIVRFAK